MLCEKGFGGEEEVELLREPCRKGLFDRFEGLVLLGLGPPAIARACSEYRGGGGGDKEVGLGAGESEDQRVGARNVVVGAFGVRQSKAGVEADGGRG